MSKKKKFIVGSLILMVFIVLILIFSNYISIFSFKVLLQNWLYWLELFVILILVWIFKLKSQHILYSSFALIAIGAILNILTLDQTSEAVLRISFVGLLVGVAQTLLESYKRK